MKTLIFIKKELFEAFRSGKMLLLGTLFLLFGIMNPAIAKLTPWMMKVLADQLADAGMTVGTVTVDAGMSWAQFFKNIPMALIIYVLLCCGIFTKEYQSGTLVLMFTKGLRRSQAVIAKAVVLLFGWTIGYLLCFGVTYGYNAYFWDNSVMPHLSEAVFSWWLFGIFVLTLIIFFSTLSNSTAGVLLGTVSLIATSSVLSLIPKLAPYTPTFLMNATNGGILKAVIVTGILSAVFLLSSLPLMNKKAL